MGEQGKVVVSTNESLARRDAGKDRRRGCLVVSLPCGCVRSRLPINQSMPELQAQGGG
jgi:hypothetical protein